MNITDPVTGRTIKIVEIRDGRLIVTDPITGRKLAFADMSGFPSGGGSVAAGALTLVRPVSDLALYPVVEASASADFADAVVLDTHGSAADRALCKVFTGDEWIALPADGLGTAFDGLTVSVDMSAKFAALPQPYYVRWCWRTAAGADSDWSSIEFPSVGASVPPCPEPQE